MGKKYDKECMGGDDCHEEKHLCKIAGRSEPDQIREIIRDSRFFAESAADQHIKQIICASRWTYDSFNIGYV